MQNNDIKKNIAKSIKAITKDIDELEATITEYIKSDDELNTQVELLNSIPGVSTKTILTFFGVVGDIGKFSTPKELATFAGLNPSQFSSGTSINGSKAISKMEVQSYEQSSICRL